MERNRYRGRQGRAWWVITVVAILLLPYLLIKSRTVNHEEHVRLIEGIAILSAREADVNEALLVAYHGMSNNYDALSTTIHQLRHSNQLFWEQLPESAAESLSYLREDFTRLSKQKIRLSEGFKSHNAVLGNSLRYLSLLAQQSLDMELLSVRERQLIDSLLHTILLESRERSTAESIMSVIDELQARPVPENESVRELYQALLTHAEIVARYAQDVRRLVDAAIATDLTGLLKSALTRYYRNFQQRQEEAGMYRLLMFLTALLLTLSVAVQISRQRKITRRLDATLTELEFQKRALDEHAIVSIADRRGNITYANQKFCDLSGYSWEQLKGQNHRIVKSDEHSPEFFRELWRTIANGKPWHGEIKNRSKHGDIYWVSSTIVPFLDGKGKPFQYISIRTDITAQKLMEEELQKSQRFLESITESLGEGVYVLNAQGNCTFINSEGEKQIGWDREEILGKNIHDIIHFQHRDGTPMPFEECPAGLSVQRGKTYRTEDEHFTHKDGHIFPVAMVSVPIYDKGVINGSVTVFQDITERRLNENALRKAKEEAEHSARMKSEFLANMSHEIRTPMNGMLGTVELLGNTPLNREQRDYVEAAQRSSEHLLGLINDILDLSKIDAGHLELEQHDFDVIQALEDLADLHAANVRAKGLELHWGLDANVPSRLCGDRLRLWQVLNNLVGNALKFTHHGSITVRLSLADEPTPDGVLLHFDVTDTGLGIEPHAQARIFNNFEQADGTMTRRYGGTGLGLSLSKKLVDLMGGEIGVDSRPGQGSRFWFTARLRLAQQTKVDAEPPTALAGKRVLIVDDIEVNRLLLERTVSGWEMIYTSCASAEEALTQLEQSHRQGSPFDIILLDHYMEKMDGLELANHIHEDERFAEVKCVMLSSIAKSQLQHAVEQGTLDGALKKPVQRERLRKVLLQLYVPGATTDPEPLTTPGSRQRRSGRVLLVDDNEVNRMVASGMLRQLGVSQIDTAVNGQEAVKMASITPYQLVLMDIQMPVMNGYEATRQIRASANGAELPIAALTAHAMADDAEKIRSAGMNDYLTKPLQKSVLQTLLDRWLPADSPNDIPAPSAEHSESEAENAASPVATPVNEVLDRSVLTTLTEILGDDGLEEALNSFFNDTPLQIERMHEGLSGGDMEQLYRAAHTLKGSSSNLGGVSLSQASLALELQAKAGCPEGCESLIKEVEACLEQFRNELQR